ncbi:hypothetical protein FRB99_006651 [Tulasnella sp. 403]|nr:hypothetical protein FRB99_006651 [Tulasnella sp. 403]
MKSALGFLAASLFATVAHAGTVLWSGDFDYYSSEQDFTNWSWSSQVGEYQWYIYGSGPVTQYLDIDSSYANPAVGETNGLKLSIDQTSHWNGQAMWRTELIPQTNANLGTGHLYYHFSVKRSSTNPPLSNYEHQVVFFESHFTELKYGISPNGTNLQWCVESQPKWSTPFNPDTWYNFAYDIDFSAGTVGLYASTGSDPLQRVANNIAASTSTNSADWHLGVLAFDQGTVREDWYFSGVYVEQAPITQNLRSGGILGAAPSSAPASSSTQTSTSNRTSSSVRTTTSSTRSLGPGTTTSPRSSTSSTPTSTRASTTSISGSTQTHWGQPMFVKPHRYIRIYMQKTPM